MSPSDSERCGNCWWYDLINEKYGEGLCDFEPSKREKRLECDYCNNFYDKGKAAKRVKELIKGGVK